MPEKIVSDQTQDKTPKPKKPVKADEPLHAEEAIPERGNKINKYGFLHIDKALAQHLGVEFGKDKEDVPVSIERIEGGFTVKIVKV